jgi:hypothetical protein
MNQAVGRWPFTAEARVQFQISPCENCGGKKEILENISLCVLQFFPVSIIPPLLHTHSSIYHPGCIMFFSQHFSFPLSVSFHHCSILIFSHILLFAEIKRADPWNLAKNNAFQERLCSKE